MEHAKARDSEPKTSSGNVFADLKFPRELRTRSRLCFVINQILAERGMTQMEAAKVLGVHQPTVWALKNYKLDKFSFERLIRFATALGQDVAIEIRPKVDSEGKAQVLIGRAG